MTSHFVGYKGPALIKASVGGVDVTAAIAQLYGEQRNWQGKQWTMEDALDVQHLGKDLLIEWKRANGRTDYSSLSVADLSMILNQLISMPFCECGSPALPAGETCAKINPACMCNYKGNCSLPCGRIHTH
jgi:hypothetical protein